MDAYGKSISLKLKLLVFATDKGCFKSIDIKNGLVIGVDWAIFIGFTDLKIMFQKTCIEKTLKGL
ncbi:hypothetical protein [Cohnella cellulosilytica]|uniref:Uncharacterized protein n=1 Tax=Cohnella cellulosilytica TaxID=986710 RepID=A0ABW2FDI4_9BACL